MNKILLLNPPVVNNKRFIRSGYCNSVSKGGYYWAPIDLLVQSGILKNEYDITVIDATALNWNDNETLNYINRHFKNNIFAGLLFITSLASFEYDYDFIKKLKNQISINNILVSGGFLLFNNENILHDKIVNGVLLDYTSNETIKFFKKSNNNETKIKPDNKNNETEYKSISTLNNIKNVENYNNFLKENNSGIFEYPIPLHKKFPLKNYYMPNCKKLPMTNIITNVGCPYKCHFCTWSQLHYRQRDNNNTITELKYLEKNNVHEIMFIDPTFGANKKHTIELLNKIINHKIKISFSIECRIDLIEENFVRLLSKAGCHSITFGIESGNNYILKKIKKNFTVEDTIKAFNLCKKYKISPTGHFIIGLPGETKKSIITTINLAVKLECDFASFNIVMPLPGTDLFKDNKLKISDVSNCSDIDLPENLLETDLKPNEILYYSKMAFKKFYLRPKYIIYRLKKIINFCSIKILFKEIFYMLKNYRL